MAVSKKKVKKPVKNQKPSKTDDSNNKNLFIETLRTLPDQNEEDNHGNSESGFNTHGLKIGKHGEPGHDKVGGVPPGF